MWLRGTFVWIVLHVECVYKHCDAEMASSLLELYSASSLYVTLLVYFEEKCCFIYWTKLHTHCSYDTETVVAFKPRLSNGIYCVLLVAFSKVSTLDSVYKVKPFHVFSCAFSPFSSKRNVYL